MRRTIILPLMLFLLGTATSHAYDRLNWMASLSDQRSISDLVIPGTHDSGAYVIPTDLGETQDWNIAQQLAGGIRFLDVRIADSGLSSYPFEIRHGFETLGNFHQLVLNPVNDFLNSNPGEVVLMSVKDEDTLDKMRFLNEVVYAPGSKFFTHADATTTLGQVRGRIVLINRMGSSSTMNSGIRSIGLRSGGLIDKIIINGFGYGGDGGGASPVLTLEKDEYITHVEVRSGALVDNLKFRTNFGREVSGGGAGGGLTVLDNIKLVSISGRSGALLDQITLHYTLPGQATLYSTTLGGGGGGEFNPRLAGIDWDSPKLHIQDNYNLDQNCWPTWTPPFFDCGLDYPKKASQVVAHLDAARPAVGYDLWVNFASANWNGLYIGNSAEVANRAVNDYFRNAINAHYAGNTAYAFGSIIPMDYPNRQGDTVIPTIIEYNFVATWPGGILPERSCSVEPYTRSFAGNGIYTTFYNKSNAQRLLYWLDYSGNRVLYAVINPNANVGISTYTTHPWVATDDQGVCKGIYVAETGLTKAFFH